MRIRTGLGLFKFFGTISAVTFMPYLTTYFISKILEWKWAVDSINMGGIGSFLLSYFLGAVALFIIICLGGIALYGLWWCLVWLYKFYMAIPVKKIIEVNDRKDLLIIDEDNDMGLIPDYFSQKHCGSLDNLRRGIGSERVCYFFNIGILIMNVGTDNEISIDIKRVNKAPYLKYLI